MAMLQSAVDVAKTHEIMARFRPIAPKPALPPIPDGPSDHPSPSPSFATSAAAALHLRARPCRARKRGRSTLASLPSKRPRTPFFPPLLPSTSPAQLGLARGLPLLPPFRTPEKPPIKTSGDLLTLSLLPPDPSPDGDLAPERGIPVERDLLQKLQQPKVIVPRAVRPVGSSITIGPITLDTGPAPAPAPPALTKKPDEVEEEVESDLLPAVVSDSRNRVRLANSAYKEMIGQPECPWLDSMVSVGGRMLGMRLASRRISGRVMLDLSESSVPATSKGFSCSARIQWACNGTKTLINAPCDVRRLYCDSKDYLFTWRFHTAEASVSYFKA